MSTKSFLFVFACDMGIYSAGLATARCGTLDYPNLCTVIPAAVQYFLYLLNRIKSKTIYLQM